MQRLLLFIELPYEIIWRTRDKLSDRCFFLIRRNWLNKIAVAERLLREKNWTRGAFVIQRGAKLEQNKETNESKSNEIADEKFSQVFHTILRFQNIFFLF